jgi:hypothetical protein
MKPFWLSEWTGEQASVPTLEHDGKPVGESVYRVRGTEDLELAYDGRTTNAMLRCIQGRG